MASLKRKAAAELSADAKKAKPQQQSSLMSFFGAPKPASHGAAAASSAGSSSKTASTASAPAAASASVASFMDAAGPKFDKAKWAAKLTPEQRGLLQLEIDTLGESWLAVLKDDLVSPSFLDLKRFLQREHNAGKKIFPPPEDLYSWSRYSPLSSVKVVILGQDPYHNHGQAHGLAFSVKPPVPAPPSLRNMYVALKNDYPDTFQPPPPEKGGLLTPWAERGVLMLNAVLTVRAHDAGSHANHGWERFTQRVLDIVAQRRARGVVFMAWGSQAAKRVAKIDKKRHLVLNAVHPSPLSAHRGFFDCRHFRAANEWLIKRYGPEGEIDWSLMPGSSTKMVKAVEEERKVEEKEVKEEVVKEVKEKEEKEEVKAEKVEEKKAEKEEEEKKEESEKDKKKEENGSEKEENKPETKAPTETKAEKPKEAKEVVKETVKPKEETKAKKDAEAKEEDKENVAEATSPVA